MKGLLFVSTPGSVVSRKDNNVVVTNKSGTHKIPIGAVEHVFLIGGVNITTPTIRFINSQGKMIFLLNQFGSLVSSIIPEPVSSDYRVRLAQYELLNNKTLKTEAISYLLREKAKNIGYIVGLEESKYNRHIYITSLTESVRFSTLNEALGIDGNLNHYMFEFFRKNMLPSDFSFDARQYHPPKDPVNAILSLTYSIYYSLIIPIAISYGFDPYLGFFHVKRGKHAAFCSDVIEVSRPWLTLFVFRLLQERFFSPRDFETKGDRFLLKGDSLKVYLRIFAEKIIHSDRPFLDYTSKFIKDLRELILR